jgi:hypothetical protein
MIVESAWWHCIWFLFVVAAYHIGQWMGRTGERIRLAKAALSGEPIEVFGEQVSVTLIVPDAEGD